MGAALLLVFAASMLSVGSASVFQNRNVIAARQRIRERMIREQAGNNPSVRFNDNESFESISNSETRMRGTGTYYRDSNFGRGRDFSFDAVFDIRSGNLRSLNYSFGGNGGDSGPPPDQGGGNLVYCASDDGRRHECSADTSQGVSLSAQRSEAACVQGRTWGFRRNYIWVDQGCRGDFMVGGGDSGGDDVYRSGSVTWRGRVDHDMKLVIYGTRLDTYVLSGKDLGLGTYQFTSPMPRRANVTVRRIRGRNDVTIAEQPSRFNKFSAIIHITDRRGGKDDTEVVVSW